MRNFLSIITDKLMKTTYQNSQEITHINIKDDNLVITLLSKFILPILMLFGFYVHSHGDYTPGGGFQSGVIFACALCLYYFLHLHLNSAKRLSEIKLTLIAMVGFVFYTGLGIYSFYCTGKFLDFSFLPFEHYNARGVFIVEIGIALIVFASVSRTFITLLALLEDIK